MGKAEEKLLNEIKDIREKIIDLDKENKKNKKSFLEFFYKPLIPAIIVSIIVKLLKFNDTKLIGIFLITFIISIFIISLYDKRKIEKIEKENQKKIIKLQAEIFERTNKLKKLNEES